jgi:hypothetical protein
MHGIIHKVVPQRLRRTLRMFIVKANYQLTFLSRRLSGNYGALLLEPRVPEIMSHTVLLKLCAELGWSIKDGRASKNGLRLFWPSWETPDAQSYPGLINGRCININKSLVAQNFDAIFGYSYTVDPRNPGGVYIRKSDLNARHDGEIYTCSTEPEPGFVYQRLINNECQYGMVEDIRLIFMRHVLPFCYLKKRSKATRFSNTNASASIEKTSSLISEAEAGLVSRLCNVMGLDYGELDCLRDRDDGRLYVVDINRTPAGPPNGLSKKEQKAAIRDMALAFQEAFASGGKNCPLNLSN